MFSFATEAETMSMMTLTPLPPVASSTSSDQFGLRVSMARSAPYSLSFARRASLVEVPMTSFAPLSFAICMPMMPTPELAPWMMMLSPGCSRHW